MNRVDMVASVLSMLGDSDETLWSASDLYYYLQDGLYDFQRQTLCTWKRSPLNDVEGQATYNLPADFHLMDRAEYDGWVCSPVGPRDAMANRALFESTGNRPLSYMISGDGTSVLRKIGVPAEDSTDKYFIEYFAVGPELTDETEIPIPARYLRYLSFYILAQAYEADGDGQNLSLSDFWKTWYQRGVDLAKARSEDFAKQRIARLGRDIVGTTRRDPGTLPAWYPAVK